MNITDIFISSTALVVATPGLYDPETKDEMPVYNVHGLIIPPLRDRHLPPFTFYNTLVASLQFLPGNPVKVQHSGEELLFTYQQNIRRLCDIQHFFKDNICCNYLKFSLLIEWHQKCILGDVPDEK